jgi:hypothetical protein
MKRAEIVQARFSVTQYLIPVGQKPDKDSARLSQKSITCIVIEGKHQPILTFEAGHLIFSPVGQSQQQELCTLTCVHEAKAPPPCNQWHSILSRMCLRTATKGSNIAGVGGSCRLRTAHDGKALWMWVATAMFAISIISSTIILVSRSSYIFTSSELFVSSSLALEILISGEARFNAPASYLQWHK